MSELFDIKDLLKSDFESLEKSIFEYICEAGRSITVYILEELDKYLMLNRDKKRYKSKQNRKTTIKTVYGEVEYSRRMYFDNETNKYVYLLDEDMQMQKVGTISTNLAKKIADAAIDMSFRKAANNISENTGQSISAHGVWNAVQQIGAVIQDEEEQMLTEMKTEQPRGDIESKVIFQEADGVWLKMQKNKKKIKSQELKLSTVYTGWEKDGDKLHQKKVYAGLENGKKFNEKTEALIQSVYNIDGAELRVVNGDGAAWIKNTYEPDMIFQLDRFHIKKEIRRCIPEKHICADAIYKFEHLEIDSMMHILETYINSIDDGTNSNKIKLAKNLYNYLKNNYDGLMPWQIQAGYIPEPPEGVVYKNMGVQENQNCSLVTMRMKGRKMRWSEDGANNMAKLIYMKENGDLDNIIDKHDGEISVPSDLDFKEVLSASKVKSRIGKGNKWIEIINTSVPMLKYPNGAYSKLLRNIQNG